VVRLVWPGAALVAGEAGALAVDAASTARVSDATVAGVVATLVAAGVMGEFWNGAACDGTVGAGEVVAEGAVAGALRAGEVTATVGAVVGAAVGATVAEAVEAALAAWDGMAVAGDAAVAGEALSRAAVVRLVWPGAALVAGETGALAEDTASTARVSDVATVEAVAAAGATGVFDGFWTGAACGAVAS
jgi:hypothetical protein